MLVPNICTFNPTQAHSTHQNSKHTPLKEFRLQCQTSFVDLAQNTSRNSSQTKSNTAHKRSPAPIPPQVYAKKKVIQSAHGAAATLAQRRTNGENWLRASLSMNATERNLSHLSPLRTSLGSRLYSMENKWAGIHPATSKLLTQTKR